MRILIRTSRWAIWARRLGAFALPLTLVPILMHRANAIPSGTFEIVELVAVAVAAMALVASLVGFSRLWTAGDLGWGRAITGLLFGLVCLAPAGLWTYESFRYPAVTELTTDASAPLPLVTETGSTAAGTATGQRLAAVFPGIRTRNYPLRVRQTFDIVDKLVAERGWDVRLKRAPTSALGGGQINAIATNLFGFRDEVSLRLTGSTDGTSVDMRSVAQSPVVEPGVNGRRVEEFLAALDARVTLLLRDQPAGTLADDTETDAEPAAPAAPTPAPAPRGRKR
jgi:hypothetical protein